MTDYHNHPVAQVLDRIPIDYIVPMWKMWLARIFGKKQVSVDFLWGDGIWSPDSTMVTTAYLFRGRLYVWDMEWRK